MSIYQSNEDRLPDSEFEPGQYSHLVVGNHGRLLDPRRTPVGIVDMRTSLGMFLVQIEDFEDKGAIWKIPFEQVDRYQFAKAEKRNPEGVLADIRCSVERFSRPLRIASDPKKRATTAVRFRTLCAEVSSWIGSHSRFVSERRVLPDPQSREGDPALHDDLQALMTEWSLWEMEEAFARQFVSNPYSGELVKGHRIVLAELGMVSYEGKVTRDTGLFDGNWSRERRADHILVRRAFVQSVFRHLDQDHVLLYRGMSCPDRSRLPENLTFVSATFSLAVAKHHFDSGDEVSTGILYRQCVPIERLFMTYYETEQMNRTFAEAEAVLLYDEDSAAF
jgi:hypothetical protein